MARLTPGVPCRVGTGGQWEDGLTGDQDWSWTMTGPEFEREDPVEYVAREIQLYGMTGPAMMFLEASRPYRALGSQAMLFFDPELHGFFGSGS